MTKTIISIMLSLVMFISMSIPTINAYANDFVIKDSYTEYNEYEMYKELTSKSDKELSGEGYSDDDIEYIRDFDYEAAIRERASLSEETLKLYGYNESEIKQLKDVANLKNIPEASLMSIARATLGSSIRTKNVGYVTENGKSVRYVDLQYTFKWKKIPLMTFADLVVIAFDSNNSSKYSFRRESGQNFKATWSPISSGSSMTQTVEWKYDTNTNKAVSAEFALVIRDGNGTITHMCWDGIGVIRLTNPDTSSRLLIDACYGHSTISIKPSFSINTSGTASFGITLGRGMDDRHDCGLYYSNFTIDDNYVYDGVVLGV